MSRREDDHSQDELNDHSGVDSRPPVAPSPRPPVPPSPRPPVALSARPPVSPSPRPVASPPRPSFTGWRNAILGTLLIIAGLAAAVVTIIARHTNETGVATAAAVLSLVIAGLILVFVVPPLARSAKLEVAQLNLPFEVTTGGGIFLVILVVVGFAAWNTGNNLLFLVFSLLCSTLFVGWVAARASLHDMVVSARFPDHIFAGEAAPVIVNLRNMKRILPSFSVLVEARGPIDLDYHEAVQKKKKWRHRFQKRLLAYFTYVPRRSAAEQRVEQLFPERGHVLINGFELSTRFPFGFVRRRRRLRARNVDIVVYPKPEAIGDKLHLLPTYSGRIPSIRRGAGQDLFSLRDYQPKDDLRHIHWKATARTRRLTVREFTSEDERRITIVLDTRRWPNSDEQDFGERFERGVSQAASLLKHFVDERAEVRLILGKEIGGHGSGLEHLYSCLRRLALVKPEEDHSADYVFIDEADDAPEASIFQDDYAIVLTFAAPGSIPAAVWRSSHVIFL
ncbi:MAG TPA: DUF58 domain-containing protein [Pyrinomonadaceae bacterium]|nr:DUF58 domain-containing protein [Pyrinomonadaceae bacterium]